MFINGTRSALAAPRMLGSRLGALAANESEYANPDGTLAFPTTAGAKVRSTYNPANLPAWLSNVPKYPTLPKAPKGSQGAIDFPYTISQPSVTGNFYWWTGSGVINIGYPQYSNDCWEYLRFALVESDFASVQKWLEWAVASFKWSPADVIAFNWSDHRWTAIAPNGAPQGPMWRVPNYNQYTTQVVPAQPAVTAAGGLLASRVTAGGATSGQTGTAKAKLAGIPLAAGHALRILELAGSSRLGALGALPSVWAQPYPAGLPTWRLWWSKADLTAFYNALNKYADKATNTHCLVSILNNWSQSWDNYSKSPGGPILPVVNLAACPPQDSFWKGLAIYVAAVAAIYGAAYAIEAAAASGGSAAGGAAAGSGGTATTATTGGALATGEIAPVTAVTSVPVASTVIPATAVESAAASGTLAEITVTGTAAAGTSALVPLSVAAAAAVPIAISAGMPSAADLTASTPNPNYASTTPAKPVTPPSAVTSATQAANLIKAVAGAAGAVATLSASKTPSKAVTPVTVPAGYHVGPTGALVPDATGLTAALTPTNIALLALLGVGVYLATGD